MSNAKEKSKDIYVALLTVLGVILIGVWFWDDPNNEIVLWSSIAIALIWNVSRLKSKKKNQQYSDENSN